MGLTLQSIAVQDVSPSSQWTHSAQDQGDFWPDSGRGLGNTSIQAGQNWFLRPRNADEDWRLEMEDKADNSVRQKVSLGWRKKAFWWLFMILEAGSGPLLTDPEQKSVWWRASLEKQTDCRSVSTVYLQEHQLEIQLGSLARWREQGPAQHQGAQAGAGCTTLKNKEVMNLWDALAGGRGDTALPPSDTKTQRPAIGARPLPWTVLLEIMQQYPWTRRVQTENGDKVRSCHQKLCYSEVPVPNLPQTRWLHE